MNGWTKIPWKVLQLDGFKYYQRRLQSNPELLYHFKVSPFYTFLGCCKKRRGGTRLAAFPRASMDVNNVVLPQWKKFIGMHI